MRITLSNTRTTPATVVYEYDTETKTVKFNNSLLENALKRGIPIPPNEASAWDGKKVVLIDDPRFHEAFHDVYFPKMDQNNFVWKVEQN